MLISGERIRQEMSSCDTLMCNNIKICSFMPTTTTTNTNVMVPSCSSEQQQSGRFSVLLFIMWDQEEINIHMLCTHIHFTIHTLFKYSVSPLDNKAYCAATYRAYSVIHTDLLSCKYRCRQRKKDKHKQEKMAKIYRKINLYISFFIFSFMIPIMPPRRLFPPLTLFTPLLLLTFPMPFFSCPPSPSVSLSDVVWSDGLVRGRPVHGLQAQ